jgi:EpsI family protein
MPERGILALLRPLRRTPAMVVTAILVLQILLFYTTSTAEYIPHPPPLSRFQTSIGPWRMIREVQVETEVQALLKADDTLSREYAGPEGIVDLWVAFFKSQRAGVSPHSPKVCLPGAGWTAEASRIVPVSVPGEPRPIPVNRYVIRHEDERALVLYWYQGVRRVTASEYLSKFYLMWDSLRYHRSDEALVRVIAGVQDNRLEQAERTATGFVQLLYPPLTRQMWRQEP